MSPAPNYPPARSAVRALLLSFIACAIAGCACVFWSWHRQGENTDGVLRSIAFVCAMAAAHLWGYQLYRRQFIPLARAAQTPDVGSTGTLNCAEAATPEARTPIPLGFIMLQQSVAALLGSIILDGGTVFAICLATIGIFWFMFALGAILRRQLTDTDRVLLNIGFWPLLIAVGFLAHLVWWIKGLI